MLISTPDITGHLAIHIDDMQPFGVAIQFEATAVLMRLVYPTSHIDVIAFALTKQAAGRVGQDREVAAFHGPQYAGSLLVRRDPFVELF